METVILTCLLLIIVLLLQDRIFIHKETAQRPKPQKKVKPDLCDIMGPPKPVKSQSLPKATDGNQMADTQINFDNLDIEYDEYEKLSLQIPQDELEEVFSNMPDLEEEEVEWRRYGMSGGDNSLAQGVTYEELSSVAALLQKGNLEQVQPKTATALVQKLQGTELFSLLENSIEGASQKIAELLDSTLPCETDKGPSTLLKSGLSDFDIGEFL